MMHLKCLKLTISGFAMICGMANTYCNVAYSKFISFLKLYYYLPVSLL